MTHEVAHKTIKNIIVTLYKGNTELAINAREKLKDILEFICSKSSNLVQGRGIFLVIAVLENVSELKKELIKNLKKAVLSADDHPGVKILKSLISN